MTVVNEPYLFAAVPPPPRVIPDEAGMIFDKAISAFLVKRVFFIKMAHLLL
jgi:hypothetical protein